MKKMIAFALVLALAAGSMAGCSKPSGNTSGSGGAPGGSGAVSGGDASGSSAPKADGKYKACFITSVARGNEFIDLIWEGFLSLEKEGWEVKCIECFETAEQAEQVYAMCQAGYNLIYTNGDDTKATVEDIGEELLRDYPDVHLFFLDTYEEPQIDNATSVTIDPFESCFVAGYVAALTTEKDLIGIMEPLDTAIMQRFEYGYYAGIEYANRTEGLNKTWITAYTNSWNDTTKGYEAAVAMNSNYDIDTLIHCAYISGYGVISACADLGLKCVGVDGWQGYIDPCVFWSALKSMDVAVYKTAHSWMNGEELGAALEYGVRSGGNAYYEPDLKNLPADVAEKVVALKESIMNGTVDVFENGYEDWRTSSAA